MRPKRFNTNSFFIASLGLGETSARRQSRLGSSLPSRPGPRWASPQFAPLGAGPPPPALRRALLPVLRPQGGCGSPSRREDWRGGAGGRGRGRGRACQSGAGGLGSALGEGLHL